MRILNESVIEGIKISIFEWNNKYILKYEIPFLEQIYKLPVEDFANLESVIKHTQDLKFVKKITQNFHSMEEVYEDFII